MTNNLTTIEPIVRVLINDDSTSMIDVFSYSSSPVFTLTEKNALSVTEVLVNGIESGVTYTFDSVTSRVTITSDLTFDDIIQITYNGYSNYSSSEIQRYIKAALVHLSINNIGIFEIDGVELYPEPNDEETNLIASIASILINPANVSYRLPDISISVPKELSTSEKIKRVLSSYKKSSNVGVLFISEDNIGKYVG